MTKKASPVRKAIKKRVGKQAPKAVSKPDQTKQLKTPLEANTKATRLSADMKRTQVDTKRQLKILKALYEIADAASAVRDMKSFYKTLHKIVGKLMYADYFFITLYDTATGMVTLPYHTDIPNEDYPPMHLNQFRGYTAYVLRTGVAQHLSRERADELIHQGEIELMGIKSEDWVGVPLITGEKILGALVIQSYEPGIHYTEDDVQILTFVAQHIATALTRARALEAARQRTEELAILNSVQTALASKLDFQSIVDSVGGTLAEIFSGENVAIGFLDKASGMMKVPYIFENRKRIENVEFPLGDKGFSSYVAKTLQPLVINTNLDQRADELEMVQVSGEPNPKSWLGVPIVINGEYIGGLTLQNWERENAYTDSTVRLLETLAGSLGVALENARLFEAEQQRVAELQIINSIQQGLASKLDFQSIIDLVGDRVRAITKAHSVFIALYNKKTELVSWPYWVTFGKRIENQPEPLSKNITRRILYAAEPLNLGTEEEILAHDAIPPEGYTVGKSFLGVPFAIGEIMLGALSIHDVNSEHAFSESDARLLQTLANSMSVALENARLFDETQQRNAELAIINSVQAALAAQLNIQGIYEAVGDKIAEIFHQTDVGIRIYDPKTNMMHHPYLYQKEKRLEIPSHPYDGNGFGGYVIRTRQTLLINENMLEAMRKHDSETLPGAVTPKSQLCVPLLVGEQARGLLELATTEREHAFSESDVRLLQTLANAMSVALENARLFDETQRLLKETEQRAAELAIINSVQEGLASKLDMQAIYDLVGEKVSEIFDADTAYICSYNDNDQSVYSNYYMERGHRQIPQPLPFGPGLYTRVIETRQSFLFGTQQEWLRAGAIIINSPGQDRELNESVLAVPIMLGNRVTGVVNVQSYKQNTFGPNDIRLLQTLANSMSIALENARLFDETQRLLKETEQRAAELAIINSVQEGLASKLDIHSIYDLVGNKIGEITGSEIVMIQVWDLEREVRQDEYSMEKDTRFAASEHPFTPLEKSMIPWLRDGQTIRWNEGMAERINKLGHSHVVGDTEMPLSVVVAPLKTVKSDPKIITAISLQNVSREFAFSDSDVRLIETLANSMSVALENARLFDETQRLLKETQQRAAELAIINSVQEGLVAQLDFKAIIHLVGNKLYEIFKVSTVQINIYDADTDLLHTPFCYEEGDLHQHESRTPRALQRQILEAKETIVFNENLLEIARQNGVEQPPAGKMPKSMVSVPLMVKEQARGYISLMDNEHEHTFTEPIVQLVTTLANSMSVALENARLFDETQRLLKETEQRNAELAIINGVQLGLVSKLDMQAIFELVGERIRNIFDAQVAIIATYGYETEQANYRYLFERGERFDGTIIPFNGFHREMIRSRKSILYNENLAEQVKSLGFVESFTPNELPKSALNVPLLAGNTVLGHVALENLDHEYAFSESDVRLLETLASSMSVALENARLFDETQRLFKAEQQRAAELAIINSVQQGLASKLDMQAIYDLVGDKIREVFDVQELYIVAFDHSSQMAFGLYIIEEGQRYYPQPASFSDIIKYLIRTRQPFLVNDHWKERMSELGLIRFIDIPGVDIKLDKSSLFVPLIVGDEVKGMVKLGNVDRENAFSDSDVRLLQTLANSMSVALENARLFDETTRRARETATLVEVGRDISATLDTNALMERIAEHARELLNSDNSAIFLPDDETGELRAIVALGSVAEQIKAFRIKPGVGIIGTLVKEGRADLINDTNTDPRAVNIAGTPVREQERLMVAPLLTGKTVKGMMAVWRAGGNLFNELELNVLTGLSQQAAIAIENARLFTETQRLLKETEQRAAELGIINTVQEGLASKLEVQAIYDLVGDKIRDIFHAQGTAIYLFNHETEMTETPYCYLRERFAIEPGPFSPIARLMIGTAQPIIFRNSAEYQAIGGLVLETSEEYISGMYVPLVIGKTVKGMVSIVNLDKDNASSDSDLRLLNTLANSMSIALESTRLFDEIKSQKQYLEAVIANSPAAIALTDQNNHVTGWNPAAERLFGYSEVEAMGHNIHDLVANNEELRGEIMNAQQGLKEDRMNVIAQRSRKDGTLVDVEVLSLPINRENLEQGFITIYHDITELQRARQQAIAANEAKSSFLATMSHEIRTPMNAVIGMSGLLLDTNLDPEQKDYAETIRYSGDALLSIINDILDFSKIEAGRMDIELQPIDLRDCVESALDLVTTRAVEKNLDIAYIFEGDVPPAIQSDVTRLRQILLNLFSNAIKFTEKGEVVLTVTSREVSKNAVELTFTVRDTGIGLSKEGMSRLFQSFSQADSSTTRKYGGTGLGLAISKRLSEMMGGTMWAESEGPGMGSRFIFTVRAQPTETSLAGQRDHTGIQPELKGRRVLIVDDNATNRRILNVQTSKWGMQARDTASPAEAVQWIQNGEAFDVAVLDMHMPEMDGLELAKRIRAGGSKLPLVLFSSLGRREVGTDENLFAAYLTKPIKQSQLFDTFAGLFSDVKPRQEKPASDRLKLDPELAARHPLKILLAEDNAVNQKLALRLLEQMGYRADVASNGLEAVESVARQRYDVVLMDVQMPEMDGLEATRMIRDRSQTHPHIIGLTANAMQGDREACLEAGMQDYIAKPIRVDELVDALLRAQE